METLTKFGLMLFAGHVRCRFLGYLPTLRLLILIRYEIVDRELEGVVGKAVITYFI
jgi:hypothetical protein